MMKKMVLGGCLPMIVVGNTSSVNKANPGTPKSPGVQGEIATLTWKWHTFRSTPRRVTEKIESTQVR